MNRKMLYSFILMGMGAVLQSIYWKTDIFYIGIIGHIAFISGLVVFPTTVAQKDKRGKKKDDVQEKENIVCILENKTEDKTEKTENDSLS